MQALTSQRCISDQYAVLETSLLARHVLGRPGASAPLSGELENVIYRWSDMPWSPTTLVLKTIKDIKKPDVAISKRVTGDRYVVNVFSAFQSEISVSFCSMRTKVQISVRYSAN